MDDYTEAVYTHLYTVMHQGELQQPQTLVSQLSLYGEDWKRKRHSGMGTGTRLKRWNTSSARQWKRLNICTLRHSNNFFHLERLQTDYYKLKAPHSINVSHLANNLNEFLNDKRTAMIFSILEKDINRLFKRKNPCKAAGTDSLPPHWSTEVTCCFCCSQTALILTGDRPCASLLWKPPPSSMFRKNYGPQDFMTADLSTWPML